MKKKHAIYKRKWQLVENVLKTKLFDILSDSAFKSGVDGVGVGWEVGGGGVGGRVKTRE